MIIAIFLLVPLGGHAGMPHDAADILRQAEAHQVGRPRTLVYRQVSVAVVGNPSRVGAPRLAGGGQRGDKTALLSGSQATFVVVNSKQTTH